MSRTDGRASRALIVPLLALAVATPTACSDDEPTAKPAVLIPAPPGVTAPATEADQAGGAGKSFPRPRSRERASPATGPARSNAGPEQGRLTVHVTRPVRLRSTPGGSVIGGIVPRTEFDSPTVLPVVRQRDGWLGVLATALPNGKIGWIAANAGLVTYRTSYRIVASLGRREVVVRRSGRVVMRFPVAVGGPSTPTPTGRFAVTDKLLTENPSSPYGCCILALSAHQPRTPQGWGGGDRVAIHATNLPESIGTAASLGCLRAPTAAMRRAVRLVPLGTIVTVQA